MKYSTDKSFCEELDLKDSLKSYKDLFFVLSRVENNYGKKVNKENNKYHDENKSSSSQIIFYPSTT